MVGSVRSNQLTSSSIIQKYFNTNSTSNLTPEATYKDLTTALGSDIKGITKAELQNFLSKLKDKGGVDNRALNYLGNLINKFDKISCGDDYITEKDFKKGIQKCLINQGLLIHNPNSKESYSSQIISAFMNQKESPSNSLIESPNPSSKSLTSLGSSKFLPIDIKV